MPTGSADAVFISEVFEGTSGNLKYVELYNGGAAPVNLASPQLTLRRYSNGSLSIGASVNLTGTLTSGAYHVVANNATDMNTYFGAGKYQQISGGISHN